MKAIRKPELQLTEYAIPIFVMHALMLLAFIPAFITWYNVIILVICALISGQGINLGYHRLLTHRSLQVPKWLEYFYVVLALSAMEETPAKWVATHRKHHSHSDEEGTDPHTPNRSLFWSHVGWLIFREQGKNSLNVDHRYARDILDDRWYMWLEKHRWFPFVTTILQLALFVGIGAVVFLWQGQTMSQVLLAGVGVALWGVVLRIVCVWHITWSVNSLAHTFGYQSYETGERSNNNWLVALIASGEGWHNNHHHDPASASVQHRWWEFDPTFYHIRLLEFLGLATNVVRPRQSRQAERQRESEQRLEAKQKATVATLGVVEVSKQTQEENIAEMSEQISDLNDSSSFSIKQARNLVPDLFKVKPLFYWTDFLLSITAAHACTIALLLLPLSDTLSLSALWVLQITFVLAAGTLYHRCLMFIHELVHLRRGTMQWFRFAWNVLCGIPALAPSFVYHTHMDHHRRTHYGTEQDAEYLPMQFTPRIWIVYSLLLGFFVPLVLLIRFAVVSPFCLLFPPVRRYVHRHHSSVALDPTYVRPLASGPKLNVILIQEAACFLWCIGIAFVLWQLPFELAIRSVICVYAIFAVSSTLNAFRSTGSHRWSIDDAPMTFEQQLADSLTYAKHPWFTELWAPVGTRFHALHHMFPSMPYHSLPEAHRRLIDGLPANSLYRETLRDSLTGQLIDLWRNAGKAEKKYRVFNFMRKRAEKVEQKSPDHDQPAMNSSND